MREGVSEKIPDPRGSFGLERAFLENYRYSTVPDKAPKEPDA